MRLTQAFSIQSRDVVAFVGGGGKTTAMFQLAAELVAQGNRVITTTTTRIFAAQIRLAPQHIFATELDQLLRDTQAALRAMPHTLIIGATNQDGKAFGVEPAWIDALAAANLADVILLEADGSRMRSFKAPAEHEPVVPQTTTLLVPVVGIDILGKPLNEENVHRANLVARLAEMPLETPLQVEQIARVLAHPQGGLKNLPVAARVIPLINQVENDAQTRAAQQLAAQLLRHDAISAVAIGAVKHPQVPVALLQTRVAAIILAAGGSTRMGGATKQLLPWGDRTLAQNAIALTARAQVADIVVVTGNRADEVTRALGDTPARVVFNPDWASGRASSVRAGIAALRANCAAAIFINADQPFLTADLIDQIIARYASTRAPIVAPTFDGQIGSPVLFARARFQELAALQGDVGGKELFEKYRAELETIAIADTRAAMDVDTPAEYARASELARGDLKD